MNEIKDLLKPPCELKFYVYSKRGTLLSKENEDGVLEFLAAAMNEKWERDCVEPSRWKENNTTDDDFDCPKCGNGFYVADRPQDYKYCPHCGVKLDPPEKK